jgi:hypothetical protein
MRKACPGRRSQTAFRNAFRESPAVLTTSHRYSVNGIPVVGLNRRAVCSGPRFREKPGFQSTSSLLPSERRCEEKGMLSATQTHLARSFPMTPLRRRMAEDMQVRNFSPHTQNSYVQQVSLFARHFSKSPEVLGPEEIRS